MRKGGRRGSKNAFFVYAQGIKTVHARGSGEGGVKKWQNSVHVVVECPLIVVSKIRGNLSRAEYLVMYGQLVN